MESRCVVGLKNTVCKCVRASFSPEIVQAGSSEGVNRGKLWVVSIKPTVRPDTRAGQEEPNRPSSVYKGLTGVTLGAFNKTHSKTRHTCWTGRAEQTIFRLQGVNSSNSGWFQSNPRQHHADTHAGQEDRTKPSSVNAQRGIVGLKKHLQGLTARVRLAESARRSGRGSQEETPKHILSRCPRTRVSWCFTPSQPVRLYQVNHVLETARQ